jgi:hypothetical protein
MSTLLWFILITAFMFFMHRGRGSMGGCGGGHAHGSHTRSASGTGENPHSGFNLDAIEEAEYEEVKEESEINRPNTTAKTGTIYSVE